MGNRVKRCQCKQAFQPISLPYSACSNQNIRSVNRRSLVQRSFLKSTQLSSNQCTVVILVLLFYKIPGERCCRSAPTSDAASSILLTTSVRKGKAKVCGEACWPPGMRNVRFLLFLGFGLSLGAGSIQYYFHPRVAIEFYGDDINPGLPVSIFMIGQLSGRILVILITGLQLSRTVRLRIVAVCFALYGGASVVTASLRKGVPQLVYLLIVPLAGVPYGMIHNIVPWLMIDVFGPFQFATCFSFFYAFAGVAELISVYIAGRLTDGSSCRGRDGESGSDCYANRAFFVSAAVQVSGPIGGVAGRFLGDSSSF